MTAKIFNDCEEKYNEDLENNINDFIDKFDKYDFSTRIEARQTIETIISQTRQEYETNLKDAEQKYIQLLAKYKGKHSECQDFESGYVETRNQGYFDTIVKAPLKSRINAIIKTIIPPEPTIEKIKEDLVGHSWQDNKDGYFGTAKRIIVNGSVKDIKIISATNSPDTYFINAIIYIQERPGSAIFQINADIKYYLGDADDWTIDLFSSNSVEIENTGQFYKYITSEIDCGCLKISNQSDATLIVGGMVLIRAYPSSKWTKFSLELAPNSTNYYNGTASCYGTVLEYEIHFVERI